MYLDKIVYVKMLVIEWEQESKTIIDRKIVFRKIRIKYVSEMGAIIQIRPVSDFRNKFPKIKGSVNEGRA